MNGNKKGENLGVIVVIVIAIVLSLVSCSSCGNNGSKRDVGHDPDGFLGYSDSFWEWYADNN